MRRKIKNKVNHDDYNVDNININDVNDKIKEGFWNLPFGHNMITLFLDVFCNWLIC